MESIDLLPAAHHRDRACLSASCLLVHLSFLAQLSVPLSHDDTAVRAKLHTNASAVHAVLDLLTSRRCDPPVTNHAHADDHATPQDFRPLDDVDVESKDGGYTVGYINTGDWLRYTVSVSEDGEHHSDPRSQSVHVAACCVRLCSPWFSQTHPAQHMPSAGVLTNVGPR